jgi:mono/diheme cytochrome c family protein
MKKFLSFVSLGFLLASCASGPSGDIAAGGAEEVGGISEVPNPSTDMAKKSGTSLEKLQRGHSVYMLTCAQCHAYPLPEDLDDAEFTETVPKMVKHAGLDNEEGSAVLAYILAVKKL